MEEEDNENDEGKGGTIAFNTIVTANTWQNI